jgi:hypothetical protein
VLDHLCLNLIPTLYTYTSQLVRTMSVHASSSHTQRCVPTFSNTRPVADRLQLQVGPKLLVCVLMTDAWVTGTSLELAIMCHVLLLLYGS